MSKHTFILFACILLQISWYIFWNLSHFEEHYKHITNGNLATYGYARGGKNEKRKTVRNYYKKEIFQGKS